MGPMSKDSNCINTGQYLDNMASWYYSVTELVTQAYYFMLNWVNVTMKDFCEKQTQNKAKHNNKNKKWKQNWKKKKTTTTTKQNKSDNILVLSQ